MAVTPAPILEGSETLSGTSHRQVYQATHDGAGNRLPLHDRSFISFSFGGKHIEDFDLIAVVSGDRMERQGYSNFEDTVSTYPNLDGQQYWSTHSQAHEFTFNLATDGIEQKTLDDFLNWFSPGNTRELILAEHPNRAILARVSQPPQLNLLPFEYKTEVQLNDGVNHDGDDNNDYSYDIKTTLYKGEIELTLISDDPYWYGKKCTLSSADIFGDKLSAVEKQQALNMIYEDNIPCVTALKPAEETKGMFFGDGYYFYKNGQISWQRGVSLLAGPRSYLYYAGTAPAHIKISFGLRPYLNNLYITVPWNQHTIEDTNTNVTVPYNTLTIGCHNEQKLCFTTPNVYTSYNTAIKLFYTARSENNWDWTKYEERLRDSIRHPYVRSWALKVLTSAKRNNTNTIVTWNQSTAMLYCMMYFLAPVPTDTGASAPSTTTKLELDIANFEFDSATGEALGHFNYRVIDAEANLPSLVISSSPAEHPEQLNEWYRYGVYSNHTEDVGDMLRSNLLMLQERNQYNNGQLDYWENGNEETYSYSHYIKHDAATCKYGPSVQNQTEGESEGLINLTITYKPMYL